MHITQDGDGMVAFLTGETDHHSAAYMRSHIDAAFARLQPKTLTLDFSGVTFMDSSGVGLALGRYKKTREQNCALILTGLSERDKRMMKLSGMQKMDMVEFR